MKNLGKLFLTALLLGVFSHPTWSADCLDPAGTTFYLVRHAEKESGADPVLTTEGQARAEALRQVLARTPLAGVHVTQWQRTQLTAKPIATERDLTMQVHSTASIDLEEHIQSLVDALVSQHCGENVLVVGHSNTVPRIINGLAGLTMPDLDERDYDNFYQVRIRPEGSAEVIRTRFGAVNHATSD